jgi:hypothetical protein
LCYHPFKVFFIGPTSILFVQVNLKKGTITVPPGEGEVVHNICLAFVTATLYLLVQPRPRIIEKVWARAWARERVRKMVRGGTSKNEGKNGRNGQGTDKGKGE